MRRNALLCLIVLLSFGCQQQPAAMPKAASDAVKATSFNVAGAPTVAFSAPDMMCPEGCGTKVKEILAELPGAKEVVVDFDSKTATVAVDKDGKFDANAAVAALVDHGFKNSTLKSGAAAADVAKP